MCAGGSRYRTAQLGSPLRGFNRLLRAKEVTVIPTLRSLELRTPETVETVETADETPRALSDRRDAHTHETTTGLHPVGCRASKKQHPGGSANHKVIAHQQAQP